MSTFFVYDLFKIIIYTRKTKINQSIATRYFLNVYLGNESKQITKEKLN